MTDFVPVNPVQPVSQIPHIGIMGIDEAHVARIGIENPLCTGQTVVHRLRYKRRAQIIRSAADETRYIDFLQTIGIFKVFQRPGRRIFVGTPGSEIGFTACFLYASGIRDPFRHRDRHSAAP